MHTLTRPAEEVSKVSDLQPQVGQYRYDGVHSGNIAQLLYVSRLLLTRIPPAMHFEDGRPGGCRGGTPIIALRITDLHGFVRILDITKDKRAGEQQGALQGLKR